MKSESETKPGINGITEPFLIDDILVDPRRMSIAKDGHTKQLTDLSWRFLMALVGSAPDITSYDQLATAVWEQEHVSDETMAQRLRQVRKILGDDPKAPRYIRTVRGKGYQLIAEIKAVKQLPNHPFGYARAKKILPFATLTLIAVAALWYGTKSLNKPNTHSPSAEPTISELVARADAYRKQAGFDANETAINLYRKVLSLNENDQNALIGLSFALSHKASKFGQSGEFAEQAERMADKAIVNDPKSAGAFAARGMADDARGRVSSAIEYYERSLSLDNSDQSIRSSAAYLHQVQGHFYDALRMEKQVLETAGATPFTDYQIALALDQVGLEDAAQSWMEKTTLLRPDNVFLNEYKTRRLIMSGEIDKSLQLLEKVPAKTSRHMVLEAIAHLRSGREEEAAKRIDEAYKWAKDNDRTCYECLSFKALNGNEQAQNEILTELENASNAIKAGDEWPGFRVELSMIAFAIDDTESAIKHLRDAYDLGYRDWRWLKTTPFFARHRNNHLFDGLIKLMQSNSDRERKKILSDPELISLLKIPA